MSRHMAVFAKINDELGMRLKGIFGDAAGGELSQFIGLNSADHHLLDQLERINDEQAMNEPPNVRLFLGDIIGAHISPLLQGFETQQLPFPFPLLPQLGVLQKLRSVLQPHLLFFGSRTDALLNLITARDPSAIKNAGENLFSIPTFWEKLEPFVGSDTGTILPLATMDSAVPRSKQGDVVSATERALLAYFFKKKGWATVDGASIVAPIHLSDGATVVTDTNSLKNTLSQATAEHYLRDTIRVALESAYDSVRDLRERYEGIKTTLRNRQTENPKKMVVEQKFNNWFRGFSSMAESASMRAVEVATQGVSEFQTNPLIAAAAGSFSGTAARKIAQDSFIKVLQQDLRS